MHDVADWNHILTSVEVVHFYDEAEFQEVKARAAKKSELGLAFTPTKKAKIAREELGLDSNLVIDVIDITPIVRARISFVTIGNTDQAINLQGST
jgi:hypothetical protein